MLICQEKLKTLCLLAVRHAAMPQVLSKFEIETIWDVAARTSAPEPETTPAEWEVIEQSAQALKAAWDSKITEVITRMKSAGVAVSDDFRSQLEAELVSRPQVVRT